MRRLGWIFATALFACSPRIGRLHTIGTSRVGIQEETVGPARLVAFVSPKATTPMDGASADFSFVLPDGDWLAIVNATFVRLSPDGTDVRWTGKGIFPRGAVTGPAGTVICVGDLTDPTAPNGARRSLFQLDTETGTLRWHIETDSVTRAASVELARVGTVTVTAAAYGEAAVDDSGAVLWSHTHLAAEDDPVLARLGPGDRTVAIVTNPQRMAKTPPPEPERVPLRVRVLDVVTGEERSHFDLAPTGDAWGFGQLAETGDDRLALQVSDLRGRMVTIDIPEQGPTEAITQDATAGLVLIDGRNPDQVTARFAPMPAPHNVPLAGRLAPGEAVFLDRYATRAETLGVTIVDVETLRARRAIVLRPRRVTVGDGLDSFIQVTQFAVDGDRQAFRLSFAGVFDGDVMPLHAIVRQVDECDAQSNIECSTGNGDVTIAPFAGWIGSVAFTR